MPDRNLTAIELEQANKLLAEIRGRLDALAGDDMRLLFAYRRKVAKELGYDERGRPADRNKIKRAKWQEQKGLCAECHEELPLRYSELDRRDAAEGYTMENTELVHAKCHHARQAAKDYA